MHFVIAGKVNCPQYVFATVIAQKLKEKLPELSYSKIPKKSGEWERWLVKTCRENEWYHSKSPIIWREISMTKGKKYYIGDVTKFLDLCQDYYGLTREMLSGETLERGGLEWFKHRAEEEYAEEVKVKAKKHSEYRCRQVCILGAGCQACDVLIMELLHIPLQNRENGLEIRLYDDPKRENRLEAMANDAKHSLGYSGLGSCRVAGSMREALYNADLVIVLDSFPRRAGESLVKWLKRNRNAMCALGNALNKYARKHCRVIIGSPSSQPVCYNATVLASIATKLHVRNIVVVTQDLGRETLNNLAKKAKVELRNLYCPPVWGFVGLNKFVDIRRTLYNFYYKVPGPRISVNLSQGTEDLEIRTLESLIREEDERKIFMSVAEHKIETIPRLGRITQLAKITAILDLLKVWTLKQGDGGGEILSLGVYSDGTFNVPEGLYWSQPVALDNGFWKPFSRYPIPRKIDINLESFFLLGLASLSQTGVKVRKQVERECARRWKKPRKFDLGIIREAVKIPVVKTQAACLSYLKQATMEELGLDLDKKESMEAISEETVEIEEVLPEKIYCECWRQELFRLKRIQFERSSTTEVEVDLSENTSWSEWSVVNPTEPYVPPEVPAEPSVPDISDRVTSSGSTICDCGEDCHCLDYHGPIQSEKDEKGLVDDDVSSRTAKSAEGGRKRKTVSFDEEARPCRRKKKPLVKFYGMKDAIVDEVKRAEMAKRVKRYERDGEDEREGEWEGETENSATSLDEFDFSPKFCVSLESGYEIIGDPEGMEALEEMRRSGGKESADDFADIWEDVVAPAIQVLSIHSASPSASPSAGPSRVLSGSSKTEERAQEESGVPGEFYTGEGMESKSNLDAIPEAESENESEEMREVGRRASAEEEAEIQAEAAAADVPVKAPEETPMAAPAEARAEAPTEARTEEPVEPSPKRRRREGVPKCCLCHCIIPEGEVGCHCGETKVMEVFKKESLELVPESEEEYSLRVEEEKSAEVASTGMKEGSWENEEGEGEGREEEAQVKEEEDEEEEEEEEEDEEEEDETEDEEEKPPERTKKNIFDLPPESFLPFSLKPVNKFQPSARPPEMCSKKEEGLMLSPEYLERLAESGERVLKEIELAEAEEEARKMSRGGFKDSLAVHEELSYELREGEELLMSSSTCGRSYRRVENWRSTLMERYQKWFESLSEVRDEFYYDMAAEDVSSDEFEPDRELSEYFEP